MEPIGTGAAANLTAEAAKGIFQVIKRHVKYVTSYEENVEKFEYTVETLKAKRTSVEQEVEVANNNGEAIKADVELWHQKKLEEEGKKVKDLEDKAKSKCFIGLCPNIKYRHEFSRKAQKVITAFDDLLRRSQFDGVSCPVVPEAIVEVSRKSYMAFDSRKMVFEQIMESLRDPTINIIGVYGTGGVGKTKLVEEAFRQANHDKLFVRMVAPIAVNRTPDIQKIQDAIAEFLGLKLEEKNTVARAHRLHPRLKKEKSILIVLDNIWAKLDVAEIGIPSGDEHKGCKILLTSRDKNVLSNQMDANATFEIGALEEKEAWELFTKIAGNIVESDELRSLTTKVAERCAGLPISITTVAGALRNNSSPAVWKDALTTLENPSPKNFTADVSAEAYAAIKLSYDHIKRKDHRQMFLFCSLLGRNAYISDLLRCAIGLGFFSGVKTVEETRNSVLAAISKFKEPCLLLDACDDNSFDMHDIVRDVALAIASSDSHAFALKHEGLLDDWPDEITLPIQSHMISMSFGSIQKLPLELDYPPTLFFFLWIARMLM